jgi:hypothetical protein
MKLEAKVSVLSVQHVPASTYTAKDGKERSKPESYEALLRFTKNAYSRVRKTTVEVMAEELLESRVELKPGDYIVTVYPSIVFNEIRYTITGAKKIGGGEK